MHTRHLADSCRLGLIAALLPLALGCSPSLEHGLSVEGLPRSVALSTEKPPAPSAQDVQTLISSVPADGSDTSVPSAAATFAAEAAASLRAQPAANSALAGQDKPAAAAAQTSMSAAQESTAMPLPGQANSHSTPSTHPPSAAGTASVPQR